MIIHAYYSQWSDVITASHWPNAVRAANDAINNSLSMQDSERRSTMEMFAKTRVVANLLNK
jgi:hypothetical protein